MGFSRVMTTSQRALVRIVSRPREGFALLVVRYLGLLFVEQMWTRSRAGKNGVCAASGAKYNAGAAVYRPALANRKNRSQRILASEIEKTHLSPEA